jgi:hypothetical protein
MLPGVRECSFQAAETSENQVYRVFSKCYDEHALRIFFSARRIRDFQPHGGFIDA